MRNLLSLKNYFCFLIICISACFLFFGCSSDEIKTDLVGSYELEIINEDKQNTCIIFDELPNRSADNKSEVYYKSSNDVAKSDDLVSENKNKTDKGIIEDNPYKNNRTENSIISGEGIGADTLVTDITEQYVINKNTKKFHYPSCSSVKDIKAKNYGEASDRNKILAQGYVPCKRCNP